MLSRRLTLSMLALATAGATLVGCASGEPEGFVRDQEDPADELTEIKCSMCHNTDRVFSAIKSADEWETTMKRMRANGMVVTDEEYEQILDYLTR